MPVKIMGLLLLVFYSIVSRAQDTIHFNEVEVSAKKTQISGIGKKTEEIDSVVTLLYRSSNIADLLTANSSVFIKNYGPGALSSTALRGGNAYQTAILWNGFNIQNPMLGQSDLSLLPCFLFDRMSVEYGGSSALWGSGAVGGSIYLNNQLELNKGISTQMNIGTGSFGLANASALVNYSKAKWALSTKLYGSSSKNNFTFKDTNDLTDPIKTQQHAAYLYRGLMEECKVRLNQKQQLSFHVWLSANDRMLPSNQINVESKRYQKDNSARLSGAWNYSAARFKSNVRAAYFAERINYTDSAIALYSKSVSKTLIVENENFLNYSPNHQLHVGVNVTTASAQSENYVGQPTLNRYSLLLGNRSFLFKQKLLLHAALRAEYISVGTLPVTGSLGADYEVLKGLKLMLNLARVYRQPTLNELYWIPGGNPNLQPEQGYTLEGNVNFEKKFYHFLFSVNLAGYSRQMQNWVLWVPGAGGISTPINLQQVWSRGTETSWKLKYSRKEFGYLLSLSTSYVLATVSSSDQENNNTVGKQLMYTPRYMGHMQAMLWYETTSLSFFHQYTGYRYTSSDNSSWLDPYQVSSLKLNYSIDQTTWLVGVFISCNNVFNTNYTIMAGYPMPLRNWQFGISFNTNKG